MTTAVFQFSGTQPLRRERLTILVIEGANKSRQDFTSHVGTGSNRHEALEDSRTILHTSSMDSEEKANVRPSTFNQSQHDIVAAEIDKLCLKGVLKHSSKFPHQNLGNSFPLYSLDLNQMGRTV